MIHGIGCDICAIGRFQQLLIRHADVSFQQRLCRRMLHPIEVDHFSSLVSLPQRATFLASRWSAKEAAIKAFGIHNRLKFNQMRVHRMIKSHRIGRIASAVKPTASHDSTHKLTPINTQPRATQLNQQTTKSQFESSISHHTNSSTNLKTRDQNSEAMSEFADLRPHLIFDSEAALDIASAGIKRTHLSISHEAEYAIAQVIMER